MRDRSMNGVCTAVEWGSLVGGGLDVVRNDLRQEIASLYPLDLKKGFCKFLLNYLLKDPPAI